MNQVVNKAALFWHAVVMIAYNATFLSLLASGTGPRNVIVPVAIAVNLIHLIVAFLADPTGGLTK